MFTPIVKKISLLIVLILLFYGYRLGFMPLESKRKIVAITQIVPHPSLDSIRQGIVDTLATSRVEIVFQDAQGNVATATQIAQRFIALKPAVIVPITTPSAQAAYAIARQKHIPVVFAAVTDPDSAKLTPSKGDYVAGVSDLPPISEQARLIYETVAPKRVGILYNPGEANSEKMVQLMTESLNLLGVSVIKAVAPSTPQVSSAVRALVGHVQAIYIPNDNTVISALDSVLRVTHSEKIPVFCSDPQSVERGALMALAPNQYAMGQQVGRMVVRILEGEPLNNIGIEKAAQPQLTINLNVANLLGINIPPSLISKANKVFDVNEVEKKQ
jgi:putative ABC transport system substrate-binding protein